MEGSEGWGRKVTVGVGWHPPTIDPPIHPPTQTCTGARQPKAQVLGEGPGGPLRSTKGNRPEPQAPATAAIAARTHPSVVAPPSCPLGLPCT